MSANDVQVGGTHYKTTYEHWDLVLNIHLDYFEGQITRYVARWRKKDGLQDLQKALHYLNKLIERGCGPPGRFVLRVYIYQEVHKFALANELSGLEEQIFAGMSTWRTVGDLKAVKSNLEGLIAQATPEPKPVPVEDSNRHAPRAGYPCDD